LKQKIMKKILFTSVSCIVFTAAALQITNQKVSAASPPTMYECYHVVDGVQDPLAYAGTWGNNPCPSWGSMPGSAAKDQQIDNEKAANGLPPHLCEEVQRPAQ
jgi:hypothetical protein